MKKKLLYIIFSVIIIAGIAVPSIALHIFFSSELNSSKKVDSAMYNKSNSAMSRVTSEKLSDYERLKLISGVWESEFSEVPISESSISEIDAVNLARDVVNDLYSTGTYPYSFDSSYDNWYTWTSNFYKCTETNFHTYSSYFWKVTFYKYNSDEFHEIYITENGKFIALRNNCIDETQQTIPIVADSSLNSFFMREFYSEKNRVLIKDYSPPETPIYDFLYAENCKIQKTNILVLNNDKISTREDVANVDSSSLSADTQIYYEYHGEYDGYYVMYLYPFDK